MACSGQFVGCGWYALTVDAGQTTGRPGMSEEKL